MNDSKIFQVPAYITKIVGTANGSLKISVWTTENMSGDSMRRFFSLIDKPGYFCFASRQIESNEILDLPMPDAKKSPSQILRTELWHNWNQDTMGYIEFDDYYRFMMQHITNKIKEKRA